VLVQFIIGDAEGEGIACAAARHIVERPVYAFVAPVTYQLPGRILQIEINCGFPQLGINLAQFCLVLKYILFNKSEFTSQNLLWPSLIVCKAS
jgi:hypothetical protein